nr:MFS transporter [uncultured Hyphomonas sp.]
MGQDTKKAVFRLLTSTSEAPGHLDITDSAREHEPDNFFRHVTSLSASKIADGLIDPKLVLSWLLTALGAPAGLLGLLVPIREAGALFPQMFTAGALRRLTHRKWAWAGGALMEGIAAIAMGLTAFVLTGAAAGWAILGALTVLALARSVCSVTYKDVLGKTIAKSRRGTATGTAGTVGAGAVLAYGVLLAFAGADRQALVTGGLILAGVLWVAAAIVFASMAEEPSEPDASSNPVRRLAEDFGLLARDAQLRRFILVRALLTSTALAPPFMVALGTEAETAKNMFGGLGLLVVASASAGLLSSYVWGRLADRSSRKVLILTGLAGALALFGTLGLNAGGLLTATAGLPAMIFILMIAYQGVRLGRSTHLVDMATPETRAAYTALSNTIIGTVLILGGGFSLVASFAGLTTVIAILGAMSAVAALFALGLEEVQQE